MDFNEQIKALSLRLKNLKCTLETEEATKNALIMPFLQTLGYDVFNPLEVVPEYVADVGVKKGEKVDYAILNDGQPIIFIECKKFDDNKLDLKKHATQLIRYFSVTEAKFIILTNGIIYKFFTDIDQSGKLDMEPFFVFNLEECKDSQVEHLHDFCKEKFDVEKAYSSAGNLKYISRFVDVIASEYKNPSPEFVKYIINKAEIVEGRITPSLIEKHTKTTIEAFNIFMSKTMKLALESKMGTIEQNLSSSDTEKADKAISNEITTTVEELEGYAIVKSVLNGQIDLNRVFYRDNRSYFNVILDDNIKKTVCRLYFNNAQKYIAFINDKKEEKQPLSCINDIFKFSKELKAKVAEIEETYNKKTTV